MSLWLTRKIHLSSYGLEEHLLRQSEGLSKPITNWGSKHASTSNPTQQEKLGTPNIETSKLKGWDFRPEIIILCLQGCYHHSFGAYIFWAVAEIVVSFVASMRKVTKSQQPDIDFILRSISASAECILVGVDSSLHKHIRRQQ